MLLLPDLTPQLEIAIAILFFFFFFLKCFRPREYDLFFPLLPWEQHCRMQGRRIGELERFVQFTNSFFFPFSDFWGDGIVRFLGACEKPSPASTTFLQY